MKTISLGPSCAVRLAHSHLPNVRTNARNAQASIVSSNNIACLTDKALSTDISIQSSVQHSKYATNNAMSFLETALLPAEIL